MDNQLAAVGCIYAASAAIFFMEAEKQKKKKKTRVWVKEWRLRREQRSSFKFLNEELRLDDKDAYRRYLRMDEDSFLQVLGYIKTAIEKKNTVMRNAISPEETLTAVLRFLATGETYRSLEYQTRLSLTFLSQTIPAVCKIIYEKMKGDYLKVILSNNRKI